MPSNSDTLEQAMLVEIAAGIKVDPCEIQDEELFAARAAGRSR